MMPPAAVGGGQEIFLGRQSIVDRRQHLRAFELLFRAGRQNRAEVDNGCSATAAVIHHALNELGLESLLGGYRGYVNLDADMLLSDAIELLPRNKFVLEILETVQPTTEIVARCRNLRGKGYTLAMDDFTRHDPALAPLLDVAHIVKVDIRAVNPAQLPFIVRALRKRSVRLLAEKVETTAEFNRCLELGFDLFQGYYFAKPEIISGKRLSNSEMVLIRLLGLLISDADTAEIEKVFKLDPGLSVNMLRLVNSVGSSAGGRVTSLGSALILLGRRQVQRWLQLLLYARLTPGNVFASPLLQLAATRGKFLELLAAGNKTLEDHGFLTGIMSLIDALLGVPLAEILDGLPVADEVRVALQGRHGKLGCMLTLAEALERGDPAPLNAAMSAAMAALPECDAQRINKAQLEALRWANSIASSA